MSARTFNASKPGRYGTVTVFEDETGLCVRLHSTVVARLQAGTITLESGGWKTYATKTAINAALRQWGCPAGIAQVQGVWEIVGRNYVDGMELDQRSGKLVGLPYRAPERRRAMRRMKGSDLNPVARGEALRRFVHRFTGDHVPAWAKQPRPDGRPYEPPFKSDDAWLAHTYFCVTKYGQLDERAKYCESIHSKRWLDEQA